MKYPKTLSEEVTWSDLIRELGNALEILSFILSSVYKNWQHLLKKYDISINRGICEKQPTDRSNVSPKGEGMDIRSKKTRESIENCFLELLRKNHVSKITVSEICGMADINRATFYKHFYDLKELQNTMEDKVLSDLKSFLESRAFSSNGTYLSMLIELLNHMKEYGGKYYVLCSENAASDLPSRTFQLLYSLSFPILQQKFYPSDDHKAEMLYNFISHGSGIILSTWLRSNCKESVEEVAAFIMDSSCAVVEASLNREKEVR